MTTVVFTCTQGNIDSIECSGHSGYARHGKDIVCAAISAVVQTAVLGILRVAVIAADYRVDESIGYLHLVLPTQVSPAQRQAAQAILQTALLGVQDICDSYPQYAKMEVKNDEVH